jgi:hypothetical protein
MRFVDARKQNASSALETLVENQRKEVKYPRQSRGLEFMNRSKRFLLFAILSHASSFF